MSDTIEAFEAMNSRAERAHERAAIRASQRRATTTKATDERTTPRDFFAALHAEFHVDLDVCATRRNRMVPDWFGPGSGIGEDAFAVEHWFDYGSVLWMNPPYSGIPRWLERAVDEVITAPGLIVVALLPSNTSAKWFHEYVWDEEQKTWRPWVREVRFHPKRLTFAPHTTNAMWPSLIVVLGVGA